MVQTNAKFKLDKLPSGNSRAEDLCRKDRLSVHGDSAEHSAAKKSQTYRQLQLEIKKANRKHFWGGALFTFDGYEM